MAKSSLLSIDSENVRQRLEIAEMTIVVYEVTNINPHLFYDNVEAFNTESGDLIWKIEYYEDKKESSKDGTFSSLGPFTSVFSDEGYLIAFKSHGWKVAINPRNGCIIKDLDLNSGGRPW